ncbi:MULTISPECIES: tryptophan dimethylallyltransferase family protein [unclassified Streptomyces]|uniref:tryptophan dimethylallyltransferase family protein n=1 Tax=unclassified Streptomyces TaxID=2593676 RepID=UPI0022509972|nr:MULTISPECIES: tryptophan dimethylallyltransferase family protein [unclassified Streptomyces]WMD06483.1 tryptophan dimethylallyltransferase family protein [Streptomyces sp. FXY-T5]
MRGQMRRMCGAAGFAGRGDDSARALSELLDLLGPATHRPLEAGPPSQSFVCDDHSPVEFSLAFSAGSPVSLRLLVEPGWSATTLEENGRLGRQALETLAVRRGFSTEPVRRVEDLFFPPVMNGRFALWCAMDLRQGLPAGIKVYVNPQAHGRERAARVAEEALERLGFGGAWPMLRERAVPRGPDRDEILFFALDLGSWHTPRVKVYVAHHDITAAQAHTMSRLLPGEPAERVDEFCRLIAGGPGHFTYRPLVSCLSYTERDRTHPSGYTVHVPVRAHAPDDEVARDRATAVLRRYGMDPGAVDSAWAAMTPRHPRDGVGLIAYVSLAQSTWQPPRVNVYFSPEAYAVRPPRATNRAQEGRAR